MATGFTIPTGVSYAKVSITSSLKPRTSAIYKQYYSTPHQQAHLEGQIIPPAGLGGMLTLTLRVGGEYFPVPTTADGTDRWSASVKLERTSPGSLTVARGPWSGASSDCPRNPDGTNPCAPGDAYWWEFTGSQSLQLSFFGVEARSDEYIASNQPSTATVRVVGDGVLNYVEEWFWVQANGWSTWFTACRYRTTCSYTPSGNGYWEVQAKVNGVSGVRGRGPDVRRGPDDIRLTASKSIVRPGESVTFTASTVNGRTFQVIDWGWQADSGTGQTGRCTITDPICIRAICESGSMTVRVLIAGIADTLSASADVKVDPCAPFGDPILDDTATRRAIRDLITQSTAQGYREGTVTGYQDTQTGRIRRDPVTFLPTSSPCRTAAAGEPVMPTPTPGATERVIFWFHFHAPRATVVHCPERADPNVASGPLIHNADVQAWYAMRHPPPDWISRMPFLPLQGLTTGTVRADSIGWVNSDALEDPFVTNYSNADRRNRDRVRREAFDAARCAL